MNIELKRIILFRCQRCCVMLAITNPDDAYGAIRQLDAVEANTCPACGKGAVEVIGKFLLEVDRR